MTFIMFAHHSFLKLHFMKWKVLLSTLNFEASNNDDLIYCSDVTMPSQNISLDDEIMRISGMISLGNT